MCLCVCVCVCVCVCMCGVCLCVCVVCLCVCVYTCTYVNTLVFVYMWTHLCTIWSYPPLPSISPSGTIHRPLLAAEAPPDDTSICSHPGNTARECPRCAYATRDAEGHSAGWGLHTNPRYRAWPLGVVVCVNCATTVQWLSHVVLQPRWSRAVGAPLSPIWCSRQLLVCGQQG